MERRDEQSIEAVKLYYQHGLSQAEVATRMGLSRPTIAKLLAHGRERGFVTIEIHDPREDASEIALRLERRFGLACASQKACARVAHGPDMTEGEAIEQVGRVGADVVTQLVRDGMSVGISWGRTMSALAAHLTRAPRVGVRVVQLKGGASFSERATHDFEIMRSFCEAFGAEPRYLPLPVIFQDTAMLSIVRRDRSIERILEEGRGVDVAVFTVGSLGREALLLNLGQLEDDEVEALLRDAVGDACSRFFTREGDVALASVDRRTVGITLDELRSRPVRVLVAGGRVKAEALDTALHMGLATHLVVDHGLALALLERPRGATPRGVRDGTPSG